MGVFLLDDLIAYWSLDDVSSGSVDLGPNGFNFVDVGTGINADTGLLNGCGRGTQNPVNYLNTPHNDLFRPDNNGITITGHVLVPTGTLTVNHPILAHYDHATSDESWLLYGQNSNDRFAMVGSNDGSTGVVAEWTSSYLADTWYFVAGFLDPANNRVGIEVDRGGIVWETLTAPFHQATEPLDHQHFRASSALSGAARIDELGMWKRILNTEELDALEGSGTPPGFSSFVASADNTGAAAYYYHKRD